MSSDKKKIMISDEQTGKAMEMADLAAKIQKTETSPMIVLNPTRADQYDDREMKKTEPDDTFLGQILANLKEIQSLKKSDGKQNVSSSNKIRVGFETDPLKRIASNGLGVYLQKGNLLPNEILRQVAGPGGDELVNTILTARSNHLSLFGRPLTDRFSIGFDLVPKDKSKLPEDPKELSELMMEVERVKEVIWKCGRGKMRGEAETPTFSQFLQSFVRNGLTYGYGAMEIIYDRDVAGSPFYAFRAIDSGTIYKTMDFFSQDDSYRKSALEQIEKLKFVKLDKSKFLNGQYTHVQIMSGAPKQFFTPNELIVHDFYPASSYESNGYPMSPIDQAIHSITTHISITAHNKLYFEHGRAARGMLIVKGRGIDEGVLQAMRLQFQQTINSVRNAHKMPVFGVGPEDNITWTPIDNSSRDGEFQYLYDQNCRIVLGAYGISPDELSGYAHLSRGGNSQALSECLDPETQVFTPNGIASLSSILGSNERAPLRIWNGTKWVVGLVFKTGEKSLKETVLNSRLSIKTSPDHRFQVIGDSGEPEWKTQEQLSIGDFVLTNKTVVGGINDIPKYKGQALTPEMMEVLGWITGDGCVVAPRKRAGGKIQLFYHQDKERNLWDRHFKILQNFGLNPKQKERFNSEEQREEIKKTRGFKSVAKSVISTYLYDTAFINWLFSIGFTSSEGAKNINGGKSIPQFLYTLPAEYRQAFLRGLFSADGHVSKGSNGSVVLTMASQKLRNQTRLLLSSLGIRTHNSEGTTREHFVGAQREVVPCQNKLYIQDKRSYFSQIGFLQDHKQPQDKWLKGNDPEYIPVSTQEKYVKQLIASELPRKYKKDLYQFVQGNPKKKISATRLCGLLKIAGIEVPGWLESYHFDKVTKLIDHNTKMDMVDVTVYDDSHAFIGNGIMVHNSNNEYKLTAARDASLRPLVAGLQDFFNHNILPIVSERVAKLFALAFKGLEKDDPEKESVRLQQDAQLHMSFNEILHAVEKEPIHKSLGGDLPLNQTYLQSVAPYLTVGQIMEGFFGVAGASKDPRYMYVRDPFYFQNKQIEMQEVQSRVQMAMMKMQQQQAAMQAPGGIPNPDEQQAQGQQAPQEQSQPLQRSISVDSEFEQLIKKYGV